MKNLIIGASGKIGSYLISKDINNIYTYNSNKINNGIKFDILKDSISKIIKNNNVANVVFLGAISDPNICHKRKEFSRKINVEKTIKIIDYLNKNRIYFIFFSSEFIYGGDKRYSKETDKTNPINEYGKQKLEVENYIKQNSDFYSIFRIGKTYGNKIDDGTLVSGFLKDLKCNKKKFSVANDQFFSPLYVMDLKKIIYFFIKHKITGIYNVGGLKRLSRFEILSYIRAKLKKKLRKKIVLNKKKLASFKFYDKRPKDVSMNINKLKKTINFKLSKFEKVSLKIIKKSRINEIKFT
tara:strand:+ start:2362 stop:3249 length:888 start_codon:yes stop_codon:yes gene_type:complete